MGIASVQRTCGIDPKVLGSVALRGIASASEKPGCRGVYATGGMGEAQPKTILFDSRTSVPCLEWFIYEGFFALLGGVGAMRPDGIRRWEGGMWLI